MVELPSRGVWVSVLLVVALVGTVLFIGLDSDRDVASPPVDAPSASPTAETPATSVEVTPAEFCDLFLTFADASSSFTADLDAASGEALVEATRAMFEMPTPLGMSDGARASLDLLVEGTLAQLESVPDVEVDSAPFESNAAEPDPAAFDLYLQAACPA